MQNGEKPLDNKEGKFRKKNYAYIIEVDHFNS